MNWKQVASRIRAGEDQHTEFKRGLGNLVGLGKAVCAFANSDGGLLVLGVGDSGRIIGISDDPGMVHERLTSFLHAGCSAPVMAEYGSHRHGQGWVHWIEIPRVRGFDPLRYRGRFWIRRLRSSVEPSTAELQELLNAFRFALTEEQLIPSARLRDLDLDEFLELLRLRGFRVDDEPQPDTGDDLRNAGAAREFAGKLRPTLYGILGFGRTPQRHLHTSSFLVRCSAYLGRDRGTEVILAGEARGRLTEQVTRALGWFRALGWEEDYEGAVRTDRPRLPTDALREALVNAVAHRDYALAGSPILLDVFPDRAEVTSPGTLPNHLTVEAVRAGGGPRSRNELMANLLLDAGLMEKRGRGFLVMRNAMRAFNGTEPDLVNDLGGGFVRVTLHRSPRRRRRPATAAS